MDRRSAAPFAFLFVVPTLAGCGGASQVTAMPAVPHEITVELQENPYEVFGADALELRDQMRSLGPYGRYGWFHWYIRTSYRYGIREGKSILPEASRESECEVKAIEILLTLETTMPEWHPPTSADPVLVERWRDFERALRVHEEGHRDIALQAANDVLRRYRRLRSPDCAFIQREAEDLLDRRLAHWREVNRAYDEETDHGRSQGAVWPPAPAGG